MKNEKLTIEERVELMNQILHGISVGVVAAQEEFKSNPDCSYAKKRVKKTEDARAAWLKLMAEG
jgi:hypothetical protein